MFTINYFDPVPFAIDCIMSGGVSHSVGDLMVTVSCLEVWATDPLPMTSDNYQQSIYLSVGMFHIHNN